VLQLHGGMLGSAESSPGELTSAVRLPVEARTTRVGPAARHVGAKDRIARLWRDSVPTTSHPVLTHFLRLGEESPVPQQDQTDEHHGYEGLESGHMLPSPSTAVELQRRDHDGWRTLGRGVALDGRHCLLRVLGPEPVQAGDTIRAVAVTEAGTTGLRVTAVAVLRRESSGQADLAMLTVDDGVLLAPSPVASRPFVRAVLADLDDDRTPARECGEVVAALSAVVSIGARPDPFVPSTVLTVSRLPDGDEPDHPLSWTCRLFHIGCPDSAEESAK
jgi:hypothetical protein